MIETMFSSDAEARTAFNVGTDEFNSRVTSIENQFGTQPKELWKSISTPQYNSIYQDQIVSTVCLAYPAYLRDLNPVAVGRKFFINNEWIYDKVYTFIPPDTCELPFPEGAQPLFLGELVNVYGQPGDEDLSRYKCLYFKHDDHSAVETWAGIELGEGDYCTFYSATFDTDNSNQRLRAKSYAYAAEGAFTDWDDIWNDVAELRGII